MKSILLGLVIMIVMLAWCIFDDWIDDMRLYEQCSKYGVYSFRTLPGVIACEPEESL